jgi:hypothetical protein
MFSNSKKILGEKKKATFNSIQYFTSKNKIWSRLGFFCSTFFCAKSFVVAQTYAAAAAVAIAGAGQKATANQTNSSSRPESSSTPGSSNRSRALLRAKTSGSS